MNGVRSPCGVLPKIRSLRELAARRVDRHVEARLPPSRKGPRDVGKDLSFQHACAVALLPDLTLKHLQSRRLSVTIHQPLDVGRDRDRSGLGLEIGRSRRLLAPGHISRPLLAQTTDRLPQRAGVQGIPQVLAKVRARERKQDIVDERDRRRRTLDVQHDRLDAALAEPDAHRAAARTAGGTYIGPKHSGWNPRSTPLLV